MLFPSLNLEDKVVFERKDIDTNKQTKNDNDTKLNMKCGEEEQMIDGEQMTNGEMMRQGESNRGRVKRVKHKPAWMKDFIMK